MYRIPGEPGPGGGASELPDKAWLLFLKRAWSGRCPQCNCGELFRSFARLHVSCAVCKLVFRREHGAMTGSMYLSAAVTEVFCGIMVLSIFWLTDWNTVTSLAVSVPIALAFAYWFLPRSIALWVGIEYLSDVSNKDPWTNPLLFDDARAARSGDCDAPDSAAPLGPDDPGR